MKSSGTHEWGPADVYHCYGSYLTHTTPAPIRILSTLLGNLFWGNVPFAAKRVAGVFERGERARTWSRRSAVSLETLRRELVGDCRREDQLA